ncbi:fructosamine kinase family protein [Gilvimarinus polysaccharolyticus]|uniref:fructosamine kinase family protein n=1 Tax=Gilvimarinus polysaccharolyticus TaxID=863921 RepID=UPI00067363E9|nr:fructosamine kinase family protein [Gilvimarinus polysaccharolyticus]
MNNAIFRQISEKFSLFLQESSIERVIGGDINECFKANSASKKSYFIKLNINPELLELEARNLNLFNKSHLITPKVVGYGVLEGLGVLVLEYLTLTAMGDESALGQQLAQLHKSQSKRYGLDYNNYIGRTRQLNSWCDRWAEFWWSRRLLPQISLAMKAGYALGGEVEQLKASSDRLLQGHNPPPSLLHGDLWAGNKSYLANGQPVLFDPASYYGDRETDIAFSLMFGGFGHDFYQSYNDTWSLPEGWQKRESLYNLYHFLNHLNLFGDQYLSSVQSMVKTISLSELT